MEEISYTTRCSSLKYDDSVIVCARQHGHYKEYKYKHEINYHQKYHGKCSTFLRVISCHCPCWV